MNKTTVAEQAKTASFLPPAQGILQRKCACGNHTVAGGECAECDKNKSGLQRKLAIGASNDPLEQEADRIADRVMAASAHSAVGSASPLIQRYTGQETDGRETAPPSVDRVLANSGKSLDPSLQKDMEQRFGQDFSRVRVHSDPLAEQSAREVNAHAYTVGHDIVFGRGRFEPEMQEGRRLIAHELAHVVQQNRVENWGPGVIQRVGFFESIARIFGGGTFSDEELKAYIEGLRDVDQIEDKIDSDNKARAVVEKNMFQQENIRIRTLLVQEMISGFTGDDDEQAIIKILEVATPDERETISNHVGIEELYDNFHGEELESLYLLFPVLDSLHPRGKKESKTYTVEEYIEKWELEKGRAMTLEEKRTLARGCIGITALELGTLGMPDLSNCYDSFRESLEAQKKMNDFLATHFPDRKALIFSKRFWSGGKKFESDPTTGKVDLSAYDYASRPGFTNYDYGLYDEKTGKWWHANHCDTTLMSDPECGGEMEVYESSLEYYSRGLLDFDRQVFCVGVAIRP